MISTGLELVTSVLMELQVLSPGESVRAEDAQMVMGKVNRVLDNFNAEYGDTYASDLSTYTVTPGLQPHTIGPSGVWVEAQRPVSIEAANLIIAGIRYPIVMRDIDWWMNVRLPAFSTTIPYNLNYRPIWPNGELWFWPVPSAAYQIELNMRLVLSGLTLASSFSMPPGYEAAVVLTTAEQCADIFGRPLSAQLVKNAGQARQRVFTANASYPRISTRDEGLASAQRGWFDYQSGCVR